MSIVSQLISDSDCIFCSANAAAMHRREIRLPMQTDRGSEQAMIATWTPSGCLSINLRRNQGRKASILFDLVRMESVHKDASHKVEQLITRTSYSMVSSHPIQSSIKPSSLYSHVF